MATNTYVALDKVTVGSNTNAVTFTSIPQGYTDLVLVAAAKDSNNYTGMRVNNDSSSIYSRTIVTWNGSTAGSSRTSGANTLYIGGNDTNPEVSIYNFQNYSNTTTYKTILGTQKIANATSVAAVGLWRSTAAITEIDIYSISGTSILAGSTFSLYGIKSAEASAYATGGMVLSDSTYWYHVFTSSGTFTPKQSLTADALVVAGGGGGYFGGGGAGGLLYYSNQSLTTSAYTVTVGAGGNAGSNAPTTVTQGGSSQFGSLTAATGGGTGSPGGQNGGNGGSGGGSANNGSTSYGTGTSGQGNNGGTGNWGTPSYTGGGGGGAGAAGSSVPSSGDQPGGNGGAGVNTYSSWATATGTGVSGYYAGGGGGGKGGGPGSGGTGGAGGGGNGVYGTGVSGTTNTGGGGGGGNGAGGAGGSGIVIVRYAK